MERKHTRIIRIGSRPIGGSHPIAIQSMCNTRTSDVEATTAQILALEKAGCEIIRVTVPTADAARALPAIKERIHIPLVADIHFDYKLAIAAMNGGADKVRINPGNIGSPEGVKALVERAARDGIPLRVGVNSGSLEKKFIEKYGGVTAEGLAESALGQAAMIEAFGYDKLVISIKSSRVPVSIRAHEIIAERCDWPLHVGITEAGTVYSGTVKSAVGIGAILSRGIGDTIRVSLTGDPLEEVRAAKQILKSLGLRKEGIEVISCPTCGRTQIDLIALAEAVEAMAARYPDKNLTVAVMGCAVNGPGEAREADLGIAGGRGEGLLFRKGEILRKLPENELLGALEAEIQRWEDPHV
ncbi:MAG: flavodoxin-dependent (E)-4-hydroxy-3-methylbut-2-enyl-diphosphate synthase [Lachnospiraceae bacterium]|nr:flavodoxin-dependent (E)-4-hydroxy-3-methylbut-2-enyl-diphosphate synthase [Lachnospiraceae bacterium]